MIFRAHGNINLHASLLPKYRGAAPIQWAIARGESVTGVTTMRIDSGLDTGDILLQKEVSIAPEDTAETLAPRLAAIGADLMVETLRALQAGKVQPRPQDNAKATLAPILKKEDGRIDFHRTAQEICNRLRGFQPWPGAFTTFRGKNLQVWAAKPVPERGSRPANSPSKAIVCLPAAATAQHWNCSNCNPKARSACRLETSSMATTPQPARSWALRPRPELELILWPSLPPASPPSTFCSELTSKTPMPRNFCTRRTTQNSRHADHGLATELVMGVLRWRSLLDDQIAQRSSLKLSKLDPEVLTCLRLAAYQLLYLDRVPKHAAVHESVELVKRARKRSAVPFVNAVLRKFSGRTGKPKPAAIGEAATVAELASSSAHPPMACRALDASLWPSHCAPESVTTISIFL